MSDQLSAPRWKAVAAYVVAVALCLLFLTWAMKLWQADLRIPFTYYGEAQFNAILVKTTLDHGWHLTNPAMGAPSSLDLRDVPMADNNLHFLIIKLIGLFTDDYGLAINLFYLLTFPLAMVSAIWVMRQFNISYLVAIVGGLLYTFLPYHFIRGQHHLFLSAYFLVPPAVGVCLWIASGALTLVDEQTQKLRLNFRDWRLSFSIVIAGAVAAGGAYYAYFTCFFLLIAGILAALRRRDARRLILPAALIGVVFGGLIVNLMPSILHLRRNGETHIVRRHAIDAETYSLRLSQLVLPVTGHRLFLPAKLKAAFNQRLFINENDDASLGLIGAFGFLILLGWVALWKPRLSRIEEDGTGGLLSHLSVFNLCAVLLATFGGASALIALIVMAKIRAYNRISIFIAFFSLLTAVYLIDQVWRRYLQTPGRTVALMVALAVLLVGGVYDQTSPRFAPEYRKIKDEFVNDARFIRGIEDALPQNAMVFQLPFIPFPENPKVGKMFDYDHARAYLHSKKLRWSYGSMKGRDSEVWQKLITAKPTPEALEALALASFQGIYLNRLGYPDNPSKIENEIAGLVGRPQLISDDQRLVFFDLREYQRQLREKYEGLAWEEKREEALHPLLLVWSNGCSELEGSSETSFRWCSAIGELQITNRAAKPKNVKWEMAVSAENEANLWIDSPLLTEHLRIAPAPQPLVKTIIVPPGKHTINFKSDARRVLAPGDYRYLVFKISKFQMREE